MPTTLRSTDAVRDALRDALRPLADLAPAADAGPAFPAESWDLLRRLGATRWSVPAEYGGEDWSQAELLDAYEAIAAVCLTAAFVFSQHEAAVRRLVAWAGPELKALWLPRVARGEALLTVGLSQLTTSRQHQPPALVAHTLGCAERPDAYLLKGTVPWVTAADRADATVIGAALEDGRQVMLLLPRGLPGVEYDPPMPLVALAGSRTTSVSLTHVEVPAALALAGPAERLLGPTSGGGLETSCLALGLTSAAIQYLREEADTRPNLEAIARRFETHLAEVRRRLRALVGNTLAADAVFSMRATCTRLALRATQAVLTVAKGAGFLATHPAQRWARQALFFLVWSCPQPAAAALLSDLAPAGG